MTSRLEPSEYKALNVTNVFAALLLAFCGAPALASSGIRVDCGLARADSLDPGSPTVTLTAKLVDHGVAKADINLSAIDRSAIDTATAANMISLAPRAATIVRQVFEDGPSSFRTSVLESAANLGQIIASDTSPLISPEATSKVDEQEDNTRTESVTTNDAKVSGTEAQLPGVSDVDLLRFRNQMYRTDI